MKKYVELCSFRIAVEAVLAILGIVVFLYGYWGFGAIEVETKIFNEAKHGMLSEIFLLGAIIGPLCFTIIFLLVSDILSEIKIRKLELEAI
ncbi:MAG: hypothetical protein WC742_03985 [Gallionellaceae bacterium]|jgi:hypothetical protein